MISVQDEKLFNKSLKNLKSKARANPKFKRYAKVCSEKESRSQRCYIKLETYHPLNQEPLSRNILMADLVLDEEKSLWIAVATISDFNRDLASGLECFSFTKYNLIQIELDFPY